MKDIGVGGGPGTPPRFPSRREELINDPRVRREVEITRRRLKDQPAGRRKIKKRSPRFDDVFICPDPSMHILMADGSQKKAGDLIVGDSVKTYHEDSFELGDYEVEHVDIINDVRKN